MSPVLYNWYISDDNPTCRTNINLTNVLVDNDCDIDPDYIEFNCSIAYRGNVAPDMQLQMSSIGVLDNVNNHSWEQYTTKHFSIRWASKASVQMRDGYFRCDVSNTIVGIQPTCLTTPVSVICEYHHRFVLRNYSTDSHQISRNCVFWSSLNNLVVLKFFWHYLAEKNANNSENFVKISRVDSDFWQ